MSHELVYTSARQGLKPGSYGFCTVMATEGLPKVLQDRLESLSGYEHPFGLTDRRAELNPVNYSHLIVNVANQPLHLLSRIADAGADYSGRSNKLAHHVALSPDELTAASPAATLAMLGFCKTIFEGPPRWVSHGVLPSPHAQPLAVCSNWEFVCGDAGWAGVLADLTLQHPGRPITMIYAPGCDVLPLVVEAMTLLPADRQWNTTFSTYFTRLPAGVECQWRFVLDGTATAEQARRNLQSPPLELSNPGKLPSSSSPRVEAARTGRWPAELLNTASKTASGTPSATSGRVADASESPSTTADEPSEAYRLGAVPMRKPGGFVLRGDDDLFARKKKSPLATTSVIAGGVVLAVAVGLAIYFSSRSKAPPLVVSKGDVKNSSGPTEAIEKPAALDTKGKNSTQRVQQASTIEIPIKPHDQDPVRPQTDITTPMPEVKPSPEQLLAAIVRDIQSRRRLLSLPKREQGLGSSGEPQELCKIFVEHPADCDLKLVTTEMLDDGRPRLYLTCTASQDDTLQSWTALARHKNTTTQIIDETPIGIFTLQDQSLTFQWTSAPDWTSPFGLLYCKLDIDVGVGTVQCGLSKPGIQHLNRLDFSHRRATAPVGISAHSLLSAGSLCYDVELRLGEWKESRIHVSATDRHYLSFAIPAVANARNTQVDLELRIEPPNDMRDAVLAYRAFVYLTYLNAVPGLRWERVTRRSDVLDEKTAEGFIVPTDLDRFRKLANDDRKKAVLELDKATKAAREVKADLDAKNDELATASKVGNDDLTARLTGQRDTLASKLGDLKKYQDFHREAVDYGDTSLAWVDAIQARFKVIEEQLEIRFAVYLEFPSESGLERVVLVETNTPPSNHRPKSSADIDASKPKSQPELPKGSQ